MKLIAFALAVLMFLVLIVLETGCSAYCRIVNRDEKIKGILKNDSLDCADKLWLVKGYYDKK